MGRTVLYRCRRDTHSFHASLTTVYYQKNYHKMEVFSMLDRVFSHEKFAQPMRSLKRHKGNGRNGLANRA